METNFYRAERFTPEQLTMLHLEFQKKKKDSGFAYILWLIGCLGLHKFYLENPWGALWRIIPTIGAVVFQYLHITTLLSYDPTYATTYNVFGWICVGIFALLQIKDLLMLPKEVQKYNDDALNRLMEEVETIINRRNTAA